MVKKYIKKKKADNGLEISMLPTGQLVNPYQTPQPILSNTGLSVHDNELGLNASNSNMSNMNYPQPMEDNSPVFPYQPNGQATPAVYNKGDKNKKTQNKKSFGHTSFNTGDAVAGLAQGINALLPYQVPKDNQIKLIESYNPFPQGTNTHAAFEDGGEISYMRGEEYDIDEKEIKRLEKMGYRISRL